MDASIGLIAVAPCLSLAGFGIGYRLNKRSGQSLPVEKFLIVQTGILTALAILIALGGSFLPERSSGIKWALSGALFGAILWTALILFTMITQQANDTVDQKKDAWIPGITNAGWIALLSLALTCILTKSNAFEVPKLTDKKTMQLTIVRDRLPSQSTQAEAITHWGTPTIKTDTELAYQTPSGWIVLCYKAPNDPARSISEITQEGEDAINGYCR